MAKAKFDFKSIEIPAAAQKPLYAGVGAGDLVVAAVKEYVDDVQQKLTGYQKDAQARVSDVQKTVTAIDAKTLRAVAVDSAKTRRARVEARVIELQADAKAIPAKVQKSVDDNVAIVTATYGELAKRGEAVVKGAKLPSTASVEVKVNPTKPAAKKAPAKKAAAKKAPAKKAAAKKAPAKKAPAAQA
ncbi:hypothetical protein [Nocardioides sp. R-C-SC26]|uniref:hypothetical protein n=1 Tax=Nocardioides sp. R-C-SC26 TaxID=2870414 RepID=UPI001E5FAFD0|nr:hypothetical protein [Nocardioides sp. R-C-SC26]